MKMKNIMLVTFLLLAVLTIGAVSAQDNNATQDDIKVADEDIIELSDYDEEEHYIDVNVDEEIDLNDDEESIADIYLPANTNKGSFRVYNGEELVARSDIDFDEEDYWDSDGDEVTGYLWPGDLNLTKIDDGDYLTFKFFEYKNGEYVPFENLTVVCKVQLTGSYMILTDISDEDEIDAEIIINNIDLKKPDENFTYVNITQKTGFFQISVEDDVIFEEDLKTTQRNYTEFVDKYGYKYYCFGFSLNDLNSYIAEHYDGLSFADLIDSGIISADDEMYFDLLEDEYDDESEITSNSRTIAIKGDIIILTDEYAVDVGYDDLEVVMDAGWNETVILTYEIKKGLKGKIIIYLNDNQTPAFEKSLSELIPDDEQDDEYDYYSITIADLNITQPGDYVLRYYFDDENGDRIFSYDEDYPEILLLYAPQTATGENASIWVNPVPIPVDEDRIVIKITASDVQDDDNVTIYVDGNETPITIKLSDCVPDDDGNYTITSQKLNLGVGQHNLNITCKGTNLIANVVILTDLDIILADEPVYTTFNDAFVFIILENKDITESSDITGLINVTITDSEGNIIDTLQNNIGDGMSGDSDLESYVIRANDMNVALNGTYKVHVIYYNGNKGVVEVEGNVTFKEVGGDDYGISISDTITDDKIITFDDLPFDYDILVEIDGGTPVKFNKSSLSRGLDSQNKKVYFIKEDQLGLTDGYHSINVSIDTDAGIINLAKVNVTVDLKENIDPALTISVKNIEEGNAAVVLITTNSTFTGNVLVQLAGANHTVDVVNGNGNVTVTGLAAGTYTATAIFKEDAVFKASTVNATFNVVAKTAPSSNKDSVKPTVKLTLKKVKVKRSAKKLVLRATLKINGKAAKGMKIIFKFKGKKYTAKTNSKGVAKYTIKKKVLKKLKKGKKVKYQASYGKITKKYTVKVRK